MAGIIFIPLYVSIAGGFKTIGDLRTNSLGLPTEWIVSNYTSLLVDNKFWLFIGIQYYMQQEQPF